MVTGRCVSVCQTVGAATRRPFGRPRGSQPARLSIRYTHQSNNWANVVIGAPISVMPSPKIYRTHTLVFPGTRTKGRLGCRTVHGRGKLSVPNFFLVQTTPLVTSLANHRGKRLRRSKISLENRTSCSGAVVVSKMPTQFSSPTRSLNLTLPLGFARSRNISQTL